MARGAMSGIIPVDLSYPPIRFLRSLILYPATVLLNPHCTLFCFYYQNSGSSGAMAFINIQQSKAVCIREGSLR